MVLLSCVGEPVFPNEGGGCLARACESNKPVNGSFFCVRSRHFHRLELENFRRFWLLFRPLLQVLNRSNLEDDCLHWMCGGFYYLDEFRLVYSPSRPIRGVGIDLVIFDTSFPNSHWVVGSVL